MRAAKAKIKKEVRGRTDRAVESRGKMESGLARLHAEERNLPRVSYSRLFTLVSDAMNPGEQLMDPNDTIEREENEEMELLTSIRSCLQKVYMHDTYEYTFMCVCVCVSVCVCIDLYIL